MKDDFNKAEDLVDESEKLFGEKVKTKEEEKCVDSEVIEEILNKNNKVGNE